MSDKRDQKKIYDLLIWKRSGEKMNRDDSNNDDDDDTVEEFIEIPVENSSEKIGIIIVRAKNPLPGNPIVIFGHGNGETAQDMSNTPDEFCPHGISVCLVDYRGYGYSDGEYGASSLTERKDMITVFKYLKKNGFNKISYFGRSLGATCGLFVAAEFPELVCIALDSPWLSIREWTEHKAKSFENIDHDRFEALLPSVYQEIEKKTGLNFQKAKEPREIAGKINQPLFLIHGEKDKLVPYTNSTELIELVKSPEKKFKSFNGGHNDFMRYMIYSEMFNFILKHNEADI